MNETDTTPTTRFYKPKEYADEKRISTRTVWRLISKGELKVEYPAPKCPRIVVTVEHAA